ACTWEATGLLVGSWDETPSRIGKDRNRRDGFGGRALGSLGLRMRLGQRQEVATVRPQAQERARASGQEIDRVAPRLHCLAADIDLVVDRVAVEAVARDGSGQDVGGPPGRR